MTRTILSLLGGFTLSFLLLGLIAHQVQVLVQKRRSSPWREFMVRGSITGTWLFLFIKYVEIELSLFVTSFLASYLILIVILANLFFRGVKSHGRSL